MSRKNSDDLVLNPMFNTLDPPPLTLPPTPSTLFPPGKPKLLVVEDDDTILTQMKWALMEDYEVFVAQDRPSALEIYRQERPPLTGNSPWR